VFCFSIEGRVFGVVTTILVIILTERKKEKDLSVVFNTYKKPDALKQTQNKGGTHGVFYSRPPQLW